MKRFMKKRYRVVQYVEMFCVESRYWWSPIWSYEIGSMSLSKKAASIKMDILIGEEDEP